jgi:hypothetical protein
VSKNEALPTAALPYTWLAAGYAAILEAVKSGVVTNNAWSFGRLNSTDF